MMQLMIYHRNLDTIYTPQRQAPCNFSFVTLDSTSEKDERTITAETVQPSFLHNFFLKLSCQKRFMSPGSRQWHFCWDISSLSRWKKRITLSFTWNGFLLSLLIFHGSRRSRLHQLQSRLFPKFPLSTAFDSPDHYIILYSRIIEAFAWKWFFPKE